MKSSTSRRTRTSVKIFDIVNSQFAASHTSFNFFIAWVRPGHSSTCASVSLSWPHFEHDESLRRLQRWSHTPTFPRPRTSRCNRTAVFREWQSIASRRGSQLGWTRWVVIDSSYSPQIWFTSRNNNRYKYTLWTCFKVSFFVFYL